MYQLWVFWNLDLKEKDIKVLTSFGDGYGIGNSPGWSALDLMEELCPSLSCQIFQQVLILSTMVSFWATYEDC